MSQNLSDLSGLTDLLGRGWDTRRRFCYGLLFRRCVGNGSFGFRTVSFFTLCFLVGRKLCDIVGDEDAARVLDSHSPCFALLVFELVGASNFLDGSV
jgi:hypothetical protein